MAFNPNYNSQGMDSLPYRAPFQATRRPYNPRYGSSVSEIMSQRGNNTGAYNNQGQMLPKGTVLQVPGWNTTGYGPGTRGYRGSGERSQGYSFERQGTAESKRPDYSTHFGGLNEFYRMQQGMSDFDRLQGRAGMDQQDAFGSQLATMARAAGQRGDYEAMDAFQMALQDRAAQRMAAQGERPFPSPMGQQMDGFEQNTTYGNMTPNVDVDPNSAFAQSLLDDAMMADRQRSMVPTDVGRFQTPYGTVGLGGPSTSSFTNAQGSAGPGGTMTNYGGVQSGSQMFQQAANRQGAGNAFAQPQRGYAGTVASDLDSYSQRLMAAKQKLGKK